MITRKDIEKVKEALSKIEDKNEAAWLYMQNFRMAKRVGIGKERWVFEKLRESTIPAINLLKKYSKLRP